MKWNRASSQTAMRLSIGKSLDESFDVTTSCRSHHANLGCRISGPRFDPGITRSRSGVFSRQRGWRRLLADVHGQCAAARAVDAEGPPGRRGLPRDDGAVDRDLAYDGAAGGVA